MFLDIHALTFSWGIKIIIISFEGPPKYPALAFDVNRDIVLCEESRNEIWLLHIAAS